VAVADANYSVVATQDVIVAYTSITAARTVALDAASVAAGQQITIIDESGNVSSTNTITVNRAGSDLIEGQTSYVLQRPFTAITFISNGSNGWSIRRSQLKMQTFTANGSWTCPPGVQVAYLLMCGGGGGGASGYSTGTVGGCGGAGGQIFQGWASVAPGTAYTITLGAAGTAGAAGPAGNNAGGNGGSTTFGALATAYGGQGGPGLAATGTIYGYTVSNGIPPYTYTIAFPDSRQKIFYYNCAPLSYLTVTTTAPAGCGGAGGAGPGPGYAGMSGGGTSFAAGGAGQPGNGTGSEGGGGGGASLGAGAAGGVLGAAGSAAGANTGGGGGGGSATLASFAGGAGGTGVCYVYWME